MRSWHIVGGALAILWAAACGDDAPVGRPIPGGGAGGGPLGEELTVFVVDRDDAPIEGARARGVDGAETTTGADGVARFDSLGGAGLYTVTVEADGFVPAEWSSISSAEVTIPLRRAEALATAEVQGTITGFDSLPVPAGGYLLAIVDTSRTDELEAAAGPRFDGITAGDQTCFRDATETRCDFSLVTRVGSQTVFAVLVEGMDGGGTPTDLSDDVFVATGFAVSFDVVAGAGETVSGIALDVVPEADLVRVNGSVSGEPFGTTAVIGVPGINVSGSGVIVFPEIAGVRDYRGPDLVGGFADASYWLVGIARDAAGGVSRTIARRLQTRPVEGSTLALTATGFLPFLQRTNIEVMRPGLQTGEGATVTTWTAYRDGAAVHDYVILVDFLSSPIIVEVGPDRLEGRSALVPGMSGDSFSLAAVQHEAVADSLQLAVTP